MSSALDDLVRSGVYQPRPIQMDRPCLRWTGAAVLGGKISIVTVSKDPDAGWLTDPRRSGEFELARRDQASALKLHSSLNGFLRRAWITRILLRTGPGRGPHSAKAETHICEGVLYLLAGVQIEQISEVSLRPRERERGHDAVEQLRSRCWHFAEAAAIYAAELAGDLSGTGRPAVRQRAAR